LQVKWSVPYETSIVQKYTCSQSVVGFFNFIILLFTLFHDCCFYFRTASVFIQSFSLVKQELSTLPEHMNSPLFLVEFVLLDL
jgi:uncharacterized membrane protein